jgi:transposase
MREMAYREVAMWEILQVLRRLGRRESKSAIAREMGHSRSTVRRYEAVAKALGWTPGSTTTGPDEELAAGVARRINPVTDRVAGEAEAVLLPHSEQIRRWLTPAVHAGVHERRGLRLTKIRELLGRQGVHVPYSSLHRFAIKHCGFAGRRRVTVRMTEPPPGELAEIDFGRLGPVSDPLSGRRRVAWALIVVLPHSRHQYVHVTFSQKLPHLIDGLEDAWAFFGGVPRRVVLDNMRTAVTKADRYDPILQRTFDEYAAYRGFVIDPAPVRDPTCKPHVERGVPYFRDSCFKGENWRGLEEVQAAAIKWCLGTAGTRTHGTTRERPLAVFENAERETLLPLEKERFDPPRWAECKVHPDHHISLGRALYSVPTRYIGRSVWVRSDTRLVRIYADHTLLKTHPRQAPGGRSTDYDDYPEHLTSYTLRDPQRLIHQAKSHGVHLGGFTEELLGGTFPWARLRQAQRLLRLGEKYGWPRLDTACRRALDFELINVKRVEAIILQHLDQENPVTRAAVKVIPIQLPLQLQQLQARFARPAASFAHRTTTPATPTTHTAQETTDARSEIIAESRP